VLESALSITNNPTYGGVISAAILALVIIVYSVFVFYFYKFLAKKNIIELNLSKYNTYSMGPLLKIIPIFLYVIEYIIILPIITFFWFAVLSFLVFILADRLTLDLVFLISASLIASVRVTSYISENLSQDLAKMLPFTLLGIALTNPNFLEMGNSLIRLSEITSFLTPVLYYLGFIIAIEFTMRVIDLVRNVSHEVGTMKEGTEDEVSDDETTE